jgi:hypothetical protein
MNSQAFLSGSKALRELHNQERDNSFAEPVRRWAGMPANTKRKVVKLSEILCLDLGAGSLP